MDFTKGDLAKSKLINYVIIYTLLTASLNFEVEINLWLPHLSLCVQKLSPLSGVPNFEAQDFAKA